MQQTPGRVYPLLFLALLLFLAGGLLSTLKGTQVYPTRILLLAGAVVLLLTLLRMRSTLRFLFWRIRSVSEPGPAVNWILVGLILLAGAGVLGLQPIRIDTTERQQNRLTESSRAALRQVTRDVELIGAFRDNHPIRDVVGELFAVYQSESRKIQTRIFDPDRNPDLAREYGIDQVNVILVRAGEARELIDEVEEPAVTQAILRVEDPRRPSICIVLGHGEVAPDRQPLNRIRQILREGGLQIESVRLAETNEVPASASVLVIAGPRTTLTPGEIDAVDRFVSRGGRLLVALEPGFSTGLEPLLLRWGVQMDGRRIRDESPLTRSIALGSETIAVARVGDHPITRGLTSVVVLAGATDVRMRTPAILGTEGANLLETGPQALFLEPSDAPREEGGLPSIDLSDSSWIGTPGYTAPPRHESLRPATEGAVRSLAAALSRDVTDRQPDAPAGRIPENQNARLVVLGDSDLLRDGTIDLYGNGAFVGRLFGWLSEREFLLRFPPPDRSGTPLEVGLGGLKASFFVVQIALPLAIYLLGFLLWMRRR